MSWFFYTYVLTFAHDLPIYIYIHTYIYIYMTLYEIIYNIYPKNNREKEIITEK